MVTTPTDDELDALVLDHLENLSTIIDLNHHLEDSLSEGRLLLAKTRQNLQGNSCLISSTSYNLNEMSIRGASFRVAVIEELKEPTCSKDFKSIRFQLIDELAGSKHDLNPSVDPIRWFSGVLVPSSLRHAQSCFRRAANLSVELATRRAKLEASSQHIKHLIKLRVKAGQIT
ncbi:hypothetical protein EWB00_006157 [Schistosoma japonicum]|uniref:Vacuolar ATPase assembly protein VMA22 n=3 Tax=Schistosoma japonicum TaxID=6182 RepID=A0A4Z2CZQ5_SCHJA|nr:hypothetical protein KSF78_0000646 [Schistosoma japonicum]KAH8850833.1 hypothetical protein KSF78_0000646 [Schistosoma japonicum]TNN09608.1 hypothetical protein EWB00_006157 [Schistosoma japonicum]TNN09609.1 hypothetical protein EWB00_006157 [Schistosoma japonicum]